MRVMHADTEVVSFRAPANERDLSNHDMFSWSTRTNIGSSGLRRGG